MRDFILVFLTFVTLPIFGCGGSGVTTNPPTPLAVQTNSLPSGVVGTAYSAMLSATGGKAPYAWSQTSGTFPPGLELSAGTGAITGTPTKDGTSSNLVFQVKDANNGTASSLSLSITVSGSTACIAPTPVNPAVSNSSCTNSTSGCLDANFGGGSGFVLTNTDGPVPSTQDLDEGRSIGVQNDGKIVALGGTTDSSTLIRGYAVTRYNSDGSLDTAFGNGGIATYFFPSTVNDQDGLLQPDGKILVIGFGGEADLAAVRFTSTGALDTTFGAGGSVTLNFGAAPSGSSFGTALQMDEKILVGGVDGSGDWIIARLNPNGTFDKTFGLNGIASLSLGSSCPTCGAHAVAVQTVNSQQFILAGGEVSKAFGLVRLTPSGDLDSTFGNANGQVTTSFCGLGDRIRAIGLDKSGNILTAGFASVGTDFNSSKFGLARFTSSGVLDTTFGDLSTTASQRTGKTILDFFGGAAVPRGLAIQLDGRFLVSGYTYSGDDIKQYFGIARYDSNGTLDPTFGDNGATAIDFGGGSNLGNGIILQSDGKSVVVGTAGFASGPNAGFDFAVTRLWP